MPTSPSPTRYRQVRLVLACLVLVLFSIAAVRTFFEVRTIMPPDDFVEYWSAGKLNLRGENPYDADLLHPLQKEAGRYEHEAVMMWNPPWTLTLVMPFGCIPPRLSQLIWQFLSMASIVLSGDWLWRIGGGSAKNRWVGWLLAVTFLPALFVVRAGQIGAFMLIGTAAFLVLQRRGWHFAAGAATVLLAIKPHLVYLLCFMILWRGVRYDRRMLLGGVVVGLIVALIPLIPNPDVYRQYWEAMTERTPSHWLTPTLGTVLREIQGDPRFGLQFIPSILGFGWLLAWLYLRRKSNWDWVDTTSILLLVSFVTASYGAWPFDLVILLPAVIYRAVQVERAGDRVRKIRAIAIYTTINLAALIQNLAQIHSFWFLWMAPTLLLGYLLTAPKSEQPH